LAVGNGVKRTPPLTSVLTILRRPATIKAPAGKRSGHFPPLVLVIRVYLFPVPSKEFRKEAIRQFKERKPFLGIFAIRCTVSGKVWVGSARNLYSTQNSSWFQLRHQGHPNKQLQQEWNIQGEPSFILEILETLEENVPALTIPDLLKEKRDHWIAQLNAYPL
jgi:hypothetical protein